MLGNKNFLLLYLAQVISNFGDRLNQMALVALVYQRSPGSEIALAKLISFTIIPVFVIGPIAGAWIDRLNRKAIMVISDILRGMLVFLIPAFIISGNILAIYFVIFVTFSISRFFIPSKMAIIPEIVPQDKLLLANAMSDSTHMIGNVVGLVAAGIIVNIRGIGAIGGFYIDCATFFVSAILLGMMAQKRFFKTIEEGLSETGSVIGRSLRRSIISEMKEGMRYLLDYSNMRFVICVFVLLMAGIGAVSTIIIVFIQSSFGTSTRDLGFLGMFMVGGLFLGSMLYGRFASNAPKRTVILGSFIMTGISIILFTTAISAYPNLLAGGMLAAFLGMTVSPIMTCANTLTHESIPGEARGRIFSSLEAVIHLAFLAAMFTSAYLAQVIDRFWILVTVGGMFAFGGALGLWREKNRAAS